MIITYQGKQSFRVQFGDMVLAFDPISKDSKLKSSSFGADITLCSINHVDMNGADQTNRGDKKPFIVKGPGEYEIQGVFIKGISSKSAYGGTLKMNTIYNVGLEGMNICFLGALNDITSFQNSKDGMENIDILFVPISGEGTLSPSEAYKFAVSLEPSIIIPMNYDESLLKTFLKEGGAEKVEYLDKLTLKKKDIEGKEAEIFVLQTQ